jgi:membrane protein
VSEEKADNQDITSEPSDDAPPAALNLAGIWHAVVYASRLAKLSLVNLIEDKCFRSSAALSFYALFSIAPIIYLAVYIASLVASDVDFQRQITEQFSLLVGDKAANGISVLLDTLNQKDQSRFQLIVGMAVLVFSATNIFIQIQTTFNEIYRVQAQVGVGMVKQVLNRVISLGIILSLGFLLIISLVLDSVVIAFRDYLFAILNDAALVVMQLTQVLLTITLVTGVIYAMFQFLPDVYIPKRYKIRGSLLVATMLLLGKYAISFYIGNSKLSELGGASASVIVLMLWIYYTSMILFLGAEAIKGMAEIDGHHLLPRRFATKVRTIVVGDGPSEH